MTLFAPAHNEAAYLKMALMGFQGSGKTFTATETAIGLVLHMRELGLPDAGKPIAFADTEKGSDWILPRVKKAGLSMITAKTRAFSDLLALVNEAEASASVLLIDSLTHFWVELTETYCARKAAEYNRSGYRLQFQDWAFLKAEWRKFTDRFVNSSLHIIAAGRAGYEFDMVEDEDTKKKQLEKTGIKMKAEGEMGYEPDLLVLMERRMNLDTKSDEHMAHVIKDRSTLLDGKEFPDPTFASFLPHIKCLNLGGRQLGVDTTRTSAGIIPRGEPRDNRATQRKIVLAEIEDLLTTHYPSTGAKDKQAKIGLIRKHFNASWVEVEEVMPLFDLRAGYDALHVELEKAPSRYHAAAVSPTAPARTTLREEINDSLPDHSAPPAATEATPGNSMGELMRAYGHVNHAEVPYLLAT
jgi:hypothetical protein